MYQSILAEANEGLAQARVELAAMGDTEAIATLDGLIAQQDQFREGAEAYVAAVTGADSYTVFQLARELMPKLWPAALMTLGGLEQLASEQQAKLAAEGAAADEAADTTLMLLIALSVLASLAGVASLAALSLSVVRPLGSLQATVRAIASGHLEAKVAVSGPQEVASLARHFNDMIAARKRAEEGLRKARDDLEKRVEERTAALQAANEELQRLSTTDALTGLANHRLLLHSLSREVERGMESQRPVSVLMLDIDNFKLFNDTYGHALGDEALRLVAGVLRKLNEDSGIPGRYGGDEFLVILPGADKAAAGAYAERLSAAVGEIEFQAGHGSRVPISLSVGLASFPEDTKSSDHLLAVADAAMYEAKRLGGAGPQASHVVAVGGAPFDGAFGALDSLVQAVQYRDQYTKTHSDLVAEYAAKLALGAGLSEEAVRAVRIAGVLHDVGKLIIPDDILKKPGPLTAEEYEVIKRHPLVGEMLIREAPFLEDVIQAVGCHHENYDGSGYPRGLRGDEIPLLGRVMAIADAYSAMSLDRPYRKALSVDEIIAEFLAGAGTRFDAHLVEVFVEALQAERRAQAA
jgi:diguanylate cyclase (GGDEF)-like protein